MSDLIKSPHGVVLSRFTQGELMSNYNVTLGRHGIRPPYEEFEFNPQLSQVWSDELGEEARVLENDSTCLVLPAQAVEYVLPRRFRSIVSKFNRADDEEYYAPALTALLSLEHDDDLFTRNSFIARSRTKIGLPSLLALSGYVGDIKKVRGIFSCRTLDEDYERHLHIYTLNRKQFDDDGR